VAEGNSNFGITSGGGFSTYYPQPAWQAAAVSGYFTTAAGLGKSPAAGYAANGRAYPDMSLAGMNYVIVTGGISFAVSGTSASCPAVAGLISNINAARLAVGKGSVGWINPALYTKGSYFVNDVTSGHTKCVADGTCCSTGFYSTAGWDPATGLGSVNYGKMATFFVGLGSNTTHSFPSMSPTPLSPPPSKSPMTAAPSVGTLPVSALPSDRPSFPRTLLPTFSPAVLPLFSPIFRPDSDPPDYGYSPRPTVVPTLSPAVASSSVYPSMPVFSTSSSSNSQTRGMKCDRGDSGCHGAIIYLRTSFK
jgi:hypothetical protein